MTTNDNPGTFHELKETSYSSWAIPGFAMLFFTFILIPVIIVVMMGMFVDDNPALAFGVSVPLFILFVLG
ncbi:hypothetical protein FGF77_24330, partial [Salmonella sp. gx-f7]|uniref:hypothetical protein n=1 Tax=Salmonella sp. gx-f7 TaxID=2582606 RepID=UPI0013733C55